MTKAAEREKKLATLVFSDGSPIFSLYEYVLEFLEPFPILFYSQGKLPTFYCAWFMDGLFFFFPFFFHHKSL